LCDLAADALESGRDRGSDVRCTATIGVSSA